MSFYSTKIEINEELKGKIHGACDKLVSFINDRPLWVRYRDKNQSWTIVLRLQNDRFLIPDKLKLTIGTSFVSYIYIRYKWTKLNDCGIEIIPPKILSLGTMSQYFGTDKYSEWVRLKILSNKWIRCSLNKGSRRTLT